MFSGFGAQPNTQPVSSAPTFSFGSQAVTQPTASGSAFSFGSQTATQPTASGSAFPIGQTGQPLLSLGSSNQQTTFTQPPTAQPPTLQQYRGLGGEGALGGNNSNANKSVKDAVTLPNEILSLVESFKKFLKDQKAIKDENSQPKFSAEPIQEISSELNEGLRNHLQKLDVTLQKNAKSVDILKKETTSLISEAEDAYRAIKSEGFSSSYSSHSNQYMTATGHVYFTKMLQEFEKQMQIYSTQIKDLELHLENMNTPYVPQELLGIIRKQHEALVALAAEIYAVHEHVNKLSVNSDKPMLPRQNTNFERADNESTLGPNPFSNPSANKFSTMMVQPQQQPSPALGSFNSSLFSSSSIFGSGPQHKSKRT